RVRIDEVHEHRGEVGWQPLAGAAREIDRDRVTPGEAGDPTHVIVVLVRDDDPADVGWGKPRTLEPLPGVREREAAIHHHARRTALDDEPVTRAAAAERREAHLLQLLEQEADDLLARGGRFARPLEVLHLDLRHAGAGIGDVDAVLRLLRLRRRAPEGELVEPAL